MRLQTRMLRKLSTRHLLLCGVLIALAILLAALGASVSLIFLLLVVCLAMMGVMLWAMRGGSGGGQQ